MPKGTGKGYAPGHQGGSSPSGGGGGSTDTSPPPPGYSPEQWAAESQPPTQYIGGVPHIEGKITISPGVSPEMQAQKAREPTVYLGGIPHKRVVVPPVETEGGIVEQPPISDKLEAQREARLKGRIEHRFQVKAERAAIDGITPTAEQDRALFYRQLYLQSKGEVIQGEIEKFEEFDAERQEGDYLRVDSPPRIREAEVTIEQELPVYNRELEEYETQLKEAGYELTSTIKGTGKGYAPAHIASSQVWVKDVDPLEAPKTPKDIAYDKVVGGITHAEQKYIAPTLTWLETKPKEMLAGGIAAAVGGEDKAAAKAAALAGFEKAYDTRPHIGIIPQLKPQARKFEKGFVYGFAYYPTGIAKLGAGAIIDPQRYGTEMAVGTVAAFTTDPYTAAGAIVGSIGAGYVTGAGLTKLYYKVRPVKVSTTFSKQVAVTKGHEPSTTLVYGKGTAKVGRSTYKFEVDSSTFGYKVGKADYYYTSGGKVAYQKTSGLFGKKPGEYGYTGAGYSSKIVTTETGVGSVYVSRGLIWKMPVKKPFTPTRAGVSRTTITGKADITGGSTPVIITSEVTAGKSLGLGRAPRGVSAAQTIHYTLFGSGKSTGSGITSIDFRLPGGKSTLSGLSTKTMQPSPDLASGVKAGIAQHHITTQATQSGLSAAGISLLNEIYRDREAATQEREIGFPKMSLGLPDYVAPKRDKITTLKKEPKAKQKLTGIEQLNELFDSYASPTTKFALFAKLGSRRVPAAKIVTGYKSFADLFARRTDQRKASELKRIQKLGVSQKQLTKRGQEQKGKQKTVLEQISGIEQLRGTKTKQVLGVGTMLKQSPLQKVRVAQIPKLQLRLSKRPKVGIPDIGIPEIPPPTILIPIWRGQTLPSKKRKELDFLGYKERVNLFPTAKQVRKMLGGG